MSAAPAHRARANGTALADMRESVYARLNRREYVHPDPLEFLYRYDDPDDREMVGLVASSLAYGRVGQILASVERALEALGEGPARAVRDASGDVLRRRLAGFRHRFTTGDEVAAMLSGAGGSRGSTARSGRRSRLSYRRARRPSWARSGVSRARSRPAGASGDAISSPTPGAGAPARGCSSI